MDADVIAIIVAVIAFIAWLIHTCSRPIDVDLPDWLDESHAADEPRIDDGN